MAATSKSTAAAEGWPPARVGHEVGAVLPEVLRPVREVGDDEDPGGLGDADGGEDHEPRRDAGLDGDDLWSAVSDREADVDGGDRTMVRAWTVERSNHQKPNGSDDVGHPEHETPEDRRSDEACEGERRGGCVAHEATYRPISAGPRSDPGLV